MAIQYLSGNRATGTASDRAGLTTYSTKSWVELGRASVSSAVDEIHVSGLDTTDYQVALNFCLMQEQTHNLDLRMEQS
jgi:hypothetical protein